MIFIYLFFLPVSLLWMEKRGRQRKDLGQGRAAAVLSPSLGAVTALWKYHLFLAARGA